MRDSFSTKIGFAKVKISYRLCRGRSTLVTIGDCMINASHLIEFQRISQMPSSVVTKTIVEEIESMNYLRESFIPMKTRSANKLWMEVT